MMFFAYFSYYQSYFILILPFVLLSALVSGLMRSSFKKYSQGIASTNLSGKEVAERILRYQQIYDVKVQPISGQLSDNFNPRTKTVNLSEPIYNQRSIAAISVAAHECGHAIQAHEGYLFLKFRSALHPVANFGSQFGPLLAIFGLFAFRPLLTIGIVLYFFAVLFHLITLPVEFDASARALKLIEGSGFLNQAELKGARKVLRAAAMTYVASTLIALASLVRLLLLSRRRD